MKHRVKQQVVIPTTVWPMLGIGALALIATALILIGTGLVGEPDPPLSENQAAQALAALPTLTPPATSTSSSAVPTVPPDGTAVVTAGGTASFGCVRGVAELQYVSPAPGFTYQIQGAAPTVSILLLGPKTKIGIQASCEGGVSKPVVVVQ